MRKFYTLAFSLFVVFVALAGVAVAAGSMQPPVLDDSIIQAHGSDGTLRIGDYIVFYGPPKGQDTADMEHEANYAALTYGVGGYLLDIRWQGIEVDVSAVNFSPYSKVMYTNTDKWSDTPRWRGFVQP